MLHFVQIRVMYTNGLRRVACIGFSSGRAPLDKLPGWEDESYGYHGDNGGVYICYPFARLWAPRFGTNDVVGCGLAAGGTLGYLTKNGLLLGTY